MFDNAKWCLRNPGACAKGALSRPKSSDTGTLREGSPEYKEASAKREARWRVKSKSDKPKTRKGRASKHNHYREPHRLGSIGRPGRSNAGGHVKAAGKASKAMSRADKMFRGLI